MNEQDVVVNFCGFEFDGASTSGYGISRLRGWWDAAPARGGDVSDRPNEDGQFDEDRFYRGARVVSLEGSWRGDSILAAYQAREDLSALQADGIPAQFAVTDPLGLKWVTGRLATAPEVDDVIVGPYFKFAFDVVARDPRKYGPEVVDSTGLPTSGSGLVYPVTYPIDWGTPGDDGRATVENAGRFTSWPVLEVTGGLSSGVELVEISTGSILRLDRVVPEGSTVVFDARRGRAYLDVPSNDVTGFLSRREWWPVPAAQSRTVQINALGVPSGTPTLTVRVSPAY